MQDVSILDKNIFEHLQLALMRDAQRPGRCDGFLHAWGHSKVSNLLQLEFHKSKIPNQ